MNSFIPSLITKENGETVSQQLQNKTQSSSILLIPDPAIQISNTCLRIKIFVHVSRRPKHPKRFIFLICLTQFFSETVRWDTLN